MMSFGVIDRNNYFDKGKVLSNMYWVIVATKTDNWDPRGMHLLSLQWRHNGRDGVSIHPPYVYLLNRLFRRRPKKISKLRVTGLCEGNSAVTVEFPAQRASNAENVSMWWRHHFSKHQLHQHLIYGLFTVSNLYKSMRYNYSSMPYFPQWFS